MTSDLDFKDIRENGEAYFSVCNRFIVAVYKCFQQELATFCDEVDSDGLASFMSVSLSLASARIVCPLFYGRENEDDLIERFLSAFEKSFRKGYEDSKEKYQKFRE